MQPHNIQCSQFRNGKHEQCRNNGKIFGHIIGYGESGQCTTCHQQLFTYLDNLYQLGRIIIQIHHIPCFLGSLCTAIHGNPHISLGKGRSIICSVTHHGNQFAGSLLFLDILHLILWFSLGYEVVYSGFLCNIFGGQWVISRHHDCFYPHLA